MKQVFILFFLLGVFLSSRAQEIKAITKDQALAGARDNNATLKMAEQDILAAQGDYRQTNAILLPAISVSHTGLATTNPLMAFGSKLNQEILTQADFAPDLLSNPRQIEDYATRIEVRQPLLNFDGIFQRKAAKHKWNAAERQSERAAQYLELEVDKAYMQLQLAYKTVEVMQTAKEAAMENKRIANNSFEQGYLQKSDALAAEVRVTEIENQLRYAKSNISNASNLLSVLMNDDSHALFRPIDSLKLITEDRWFNELSYDRADIQALASAK